MAAFFTITVFYPRNVSLLGTVDDIVVHTFAKQECYFYIIILLYLIIHTYILIFVYVAIDFPNTIRLIVWLADHVMSL